MLLLLLGLLLVAVPEEGAGEWGSYRCGPLLRYFARAALTCGFVALSMHGAYLCRDIVAKAAGGVLKRRRDGETKSWVLRLCCSTAGPSLGAY